MAAFRACARRVGMTRAIAIARASARWRPLVALALACLGGAAVYGLPSRGADTLSAADLDARLQPARASEQVACPWRSAARAPLVLVALGQSNAGNHGTRRGTSTQGVLWHEGRCYAIADPLAGATGSGGSIWSRLAAGIGSPDVVLVVLAVDATSIADWKGSGALAARLTAVLDDLRRQQLTVSAILWQQGEADARRNIARDEYMRELTALVRRLRNNGVAAPILVARSTRCRNDGSAAIREAVATVSAREPGVLAGADVDSLDNTARADGCHLNEAGLQRAATLWLDALRAAHVSGVAP
jgi:hypothetical protein